MYRFQISGSRMLIYWAFSLRDKTINEIENKIGYYCRYLKFYINKLRARYCDFVRRWITSLVDRGFCYVVPKEY
jgi:hypothetical protein